MKQTLVEHPVGADDGDPIEPQLARRDSELGGTGSRVERARPPMKILIVSYWFPPLNVIGAVRVGKFAKYLHEAGHDVRVLTARNVGDSSLPVEIPPDRVFLADDWNVDALFDPVVHAVRRLGGKLRPHKTTDLEKVAAVPQFSTTGPTGLHATMVRHYYALLRIPDARAGWIGDGTAEGRRVVRDWRPDIIVASAPPNAGLVVASRIARSCGVPWVAELRDLWVDNPYYEHPTWRLWVDRLLEWRTLRTAAGLVSVTPNWTDSLRHYGLPCITILNGFAEEDLPKDCPGPPPGDVVSIIYTGNIYTGFRDPTPLFRAINLLGSERERVLVHFYGPEREDVEGLAAGAGVWDRVVLHDRVSYKDSLLLQAKADVLMLLQWNNPKDEGNVPAKFFEYLAALRPILMHGYERGILAKMVRERNAGLVSNDPATIAAQLKVWIAQRTSGIPALDVSARQQMTRDEQFRKFEQFLQAEILGEARSG
jgi:glycosyltransferase involved in cell wall biosynthesis